MPCFAFHCLCFTCLTERPNATIYGKWLISNPPSKTFPTYFHPHESWYYAATSTASTATHKVSIPMLHFCLNHERIFCLATCWFSVKPKAMAVNCTTKAPLSFEIWKSEWDSIKKPDNSMCLNYRQQTPWLMNGQPMHWCLFIHMPSAVLTRNSTKNGIICSRMFWLTLTRRRSPSPQTVSELERSFYYRAVAIASLNGTEISHLGSEQTYSLTRTSTMTSLVSMNSTSTRSTRSTDDGHHSTTIRTPSTPTTYSMPFDLQSKPKRSHDTIVVPPSPRQAPPNSVGGIYGGGFGLEGSWKMLEKGSRHTVHLQMCHIKIVK